MQSCLATSALALLAFAPACAVDDTRDPGSDDDGNADGSEFEDQDWDVELKPAFPGDPSVSMYQLYSHVDFTVSMTYEGSAKTEIQLEEHIAFGEADPTTSGIMVQPTIDGDAWESVGSVFTIYLLNWEESWLDVHVSVRKYQRDSGT